MTEGATSITVTTAPNPGAVAIIQLHGHDAVDVLARLTGVNDWPARRMRYVNFADIDDGCAAVLRIGNDACVQIMPHGGPRVLQKMIDELARLGCVYGDAVAARELYPEAASDLEADMLATLSRAVSGAAINLLLAQPQRWHDALDQPLDAQAILKRSDVLDRLVDPPSVVVVGRANVGKSTLTNRLMGRSVSVVADLPGTTRDWVGGVVELGGEGPRGEDGGLGVAREGLDNQVPATDHWPLSTNLPTPDTRQPTADSRHPTPCTIAVRWLDTPGLRAGADPIERRAIELTRLVVADAEVLIAMRDPATPWPAAEQLPRTPDLWLINKADLLDHSVAGDDSDSIEPLLISARHDRGIDALEAAIVRLLGLDDLHDDIPWAFSPKLRRYASADRAALQRYVDPHLPRR